jgi:hypothetical protein
VHENDERLAALDGLQYKVLSQGDAAPLHLWGAHQVWYGASCVSPKNLRNAWSSTSRDSGALAPRSWSS